MRSDFPTQTKVSGTLRVVLHLDSYFLKAYRLFVLLLVRLGGRAPIPYVQDAIFNLRHPYIVIATAMTDKTSTTAQSPLLNTSHPHLERTPRSAISPTQREHLSLPSPIPTRREHLSHLSPPHLSLPSPTPSRREHLSLPSPTPSRREQIQQKCRQPIMTQLKQ